MRKDKGLNGDLDRLPMLTWIMFLKFLDDLEQQREDEAELAGERFRPAIEPPYRWRDWAAEPDGITGDELLAFINHEECTRPDGKRGPGLFAYLRGLPARNGDDRRDVIATVFKGVDNRMKSGYLLRDVINKVDGIHFTSSEELHTLGALYESMLREMRDAAGDSGEFYTPRAVVRFMVAVIDPRLGETVLDPACGTAASWSRRITHLAKQVQDRGRPQDAAGSASVGGEAKPLPYLLCQMNLLLHGLDAPADRPRQRLRFKLTEIGEQDRVDVILTNPPFGGEEEKGIQGNFPEDKQTAETALLFLQLIMRQTAPPAHQRRPPGARRRGRAQRHAVRRRRLRPHQGGAAEGVQPAHHRPPAQRRVRALHQHPDQPAVLRPLRADEGGLVLRAPAARGPEELHQDPADPVRGVRAAAWRGGASARRTSGRGRSPPPSCWPTAATSTARTRAARRTSRTCRLSNWSASILQKEQRIAEIVGEIQGLLAQGHGMSKWPWCRSVRSLRHRKEFITIDDLTTYKRARVQLHAKGIVLRDEVPVRQSRRSSSRFVVRESFWLRRLTRKSEASASCLTS